MSLRAGWYVTDYFTGEHRYCSSVWASSRKHADFLCRRRGFGERVMYGPERRRPEVRASTMLKKRKRYLSARRFHAITYLCFLAHHSGVQAAGTFLSDEGVLHQAAHCACNLSKWSKLLPRVLELERSVPGYLSPKELEE